MPLPQPTPLRSIPERLRYYTLDDTAFLCRRAPRTIANLISKHQLPVRRAWDVRRRLRKRITLISYPVVRQLQEMTMFKPTKQQQADAKARQVKT